jgi:DNA polymerase III delta prime subunit
MDREIQKADFVVLVCTEIYRRRVEGREEPTKGRGVLWEAKLVYNHLYQTETAVQRFVPILMEDAVQSSIPWPMQGLTSYRINTAEGYEDFYRHLTGQPRHDKPVLGTVKALPVSLPQSYPASLELTELTPLTSLDRRNRKQMLKRVRLDWIEGVLNQSLYKIARIELDLESNTDLVEHPLSATVQNPDCDAAPVPMGTTISDIFDAHAGSLLILGVPGTGKTTLLLELLRELLKRAEEDGSYPIATIFHLSSWAKRRQPLAQWLVEELNERSDVPKRLARRWVEAEQIIPLLDGLDEVAVEHRQGCVEAINVFRRGHGLLPIAVCSRTADYEVLGTKLRLRSAVVIQPLTRMQLSEYLRRGDEPIAGLGNALNEDPSLWELLETPLMLWVAMLAYRHAPMRYSHEDSLDQRRRNLLASFIEAMFKRRSADLHYTQSQTVRWLTALASALTHNRETVFQLENLSSEWLPTHTQRLLSKAGTVFACGLAGGPLLGLSHGLITSLIYTLLTLRHTNLARLSSLLGTTARYGLEDWTPAWLGLAICFGLAGAFLELRPTEAIRITTAGIASRLGRAFRAGLLLGATVWLGLCPLVLWSWDPKALIHDPRMQGWLALAGLSPNEQFNLWSGALAKWLAVLGLGLIVVPIAGLIAGLLVLAFGEVVEERTSPNQGTHRSARTAVAAVLILGLSGGLIGILRSGPLYKASGVMNVGSISGLVLGLAYGLTCGLIIGMVAGGLFSLRHFVLRLALRISGLAPLHYVSFLDHAVERLFLRKVGGGYMFVHRELMEYFASLAEAYRS